MTRRGLTMLETLLALTLLSAVSIATFSWVQNASRTSADIGARLGWETAANGTLELIGDLVASPSVHQLEADARITATENSLAIAGEHPRPAILTFALPDGIVSLESEGRTRLLMTDVSWVTWTFDQRAQTLHVTLTSARGQSLSRSYAIR